MIDRRVFLKLGTAAVLLGCMVGQASAAATQFDFAADLAATLGPGTMDYFNGATTSGAVSFGTASALGLPALPGGDASVIALPAFTPSQALQLFPNCAPNGGTGDINLYTVIWDLLVPDIGPAGTYMSLYNTSSANSNDGDFFLKSDGTVAGIGISSQYQGALTPNEWHRVAMSVDLTTSTMNKYIDGALAGTQVLGSGAGGRWSLWADGQATLLMADEDGETLPGYLNSVYFIDEALDAATIASYGGADANGVVPEPSQIVLLVCGALCVGLAWLRRRAAG